MLEAITGPCLDKVSTGTALVGDDLLRADPLTEGRFISGGGEVWQVPGEAILVIDADADFTCQVLAEGVDLEAFSSALETWLEGSDYRLVGNLPLIQRNERGLYVFGRAERGGYVQIHISNLPNGRISALLTRSETNQTARRVLGR